MTENDLISRAALLEDIEDWYNRIGETMNPTDTIIRNVLSSVMDSINEVPAVEAEPVRHGRWIRVDMFKSWECSECGALERHNCFDYCHCGAKMDAKEE